MATYLVHTGTGTFFDANDDVYILNTSDIPEDKMEQALEDLDNDMAAEVAFQYGTKFSM